MSSSTTLIAFIFLIVFLPLVWAVLVYNKLVRLKNASLNGLSQIDVQLKRRYDLIPNLVEVAKKYMAHESQTLQAVIAARNNALGAAQQLTNRAGDPASVAQFSQADAALGGAMARFMAVAEAYPTLKADSVMQGLTEELVSTENRVGFARQGYNDQTTDYNSAVEQFPAVLLARSMGFTVRELLESTQSEIERSSVQVKF